MLCHRMEKRFCFEWQTPGLGPLCAFGDSWSGPPGLRPLRFQCRICGLTAVQVHGSSLFPLHSSLFLFFLVMLHMVLIVIIVIVIAVSVAFVLLGNAS